MDKAKTYDQATIRTLIQRFFDATISPEEMDTLLAVASCPEKYLGDNDDTVLAADLTLIASLGTASEKILETAVPPGLEQKLERHISRIAGKPKLRKKWLYSISAAAAIVAVFSIGIKVSVTQSSLPAQNAIDSPDTSSFALALPPLENNVRVENTGGTASVSSPVASVNVSEKTRKPKIHVKSSTSQSAEMIEPVQIHDVLPSLGKMPSMSDLVADITPTLSVVSIDPAGMLAQPLSTLSQSVDNVYESLDIVAKALSGVNASITSAAEGLAPVSDLPLHTI